MANLLKKSKKSSVTIDDLMKKQLNLYPLKNGRLSVTQKRIRLGIILAAFLVVSVIGTTVYVGIQNAVIEADIASMQADLKIEKERLNNQKFLDDLMKRIEYKSQLLNFIDQKNTSATLVIETIERNVPKNVQYLNLDFVSDNTIRISCKTTDLEWIAKFVHQLKLENFFTSVFVESIQSNKSTLSVGEPLEYEFQIICGFGGQLDETQK